MTAKELITKLETFHPNTQVFLASDEEGNNYQKLNPYLETEEFEKTNNDGNFEAIVLYPSGEDVTKADY